MPGKVKQGEKKDLVQRKARVKNRKLEEGKQAGWNGPATITIFQLDTSLVTIPLGRQQCFYYTILNLLVVPAVYALLLLKFLGAVQ